MRTPLAAHAVAWLLAAVLGLGAADARANEKLPQHYRNWLEKEVVYIITKEERDAFRRLTSDGDRDKFIEQFWEVRNPTPGAPTNPYKEEHYRRVEHANQYFGKESGTDGWRTDRGRVYITLGPPQQRAFYTSLQKLRPMEIWFYSSSHPGLPPFFYVVFYQRENIGDFRLYSPYFDGPEKLITTMRGQNDRVQSLRIVEEAAGREVARISLSLVPDEPVDLQNATSSLQSDVMLSTIRNLANHPLTRLDLDRRRALMETVTHRLIIEGDVLKVFTVPLRDADGNTNLHYVLRLPKPEDFAVGESNDHRYYYSVAVTTRVSGLDGKLIFSHEKTFSRYLDKSHLDQVKNKVFGYEGGLPLPPGKYKLEFLLTNLLKQMTFRAKKEIVVPEVPADSVRMTDLVPFAEARAVDPLQSRALPFGVSGVKFTPLLGHELTLAPEQDLNIFYQIWAPPRDPRTYQGRTLLVEYAYGRPGGRGESKIVRDEVLKEQFDPFGSLVSGKRISLVGLPLGNYLMTATLNDPETQQRTHATLSFRVSNTSSIPPAWDIYDEEVGEDIRKGLLDHQRGLCYVALGLKEQAVSWFRRALEKNPNNEEARARLVEFYFARQEFAEVTNLFSRVGISSQTDEQTILRLAESLAKTGNTKRAITLLESALALRSENGPLHLVLATYYQQTGEAKKASELERKGKALVGTPSPNP